MIVLFIALAFSCPSGFVQASQNDESSATGFRQEYSGGQFSRSQQPLPPLSRDYARLSSIRTSPLRSPNLPVDVDRLSVKQGEHPYALLGRFSLLSASHTVMIISIKFCFELGKPGNYCAVSFPISLLFSVNLFSPPLCLSLCLSLSVSLSLSLSLCLSLSLSLSLSLAWFMFNYSHMPTQTWNLQGLYAYFSSVFLPPTTTLLKFTAEQKRRAISKQYSIFASLQKHPTHRMRILATLVWQLHVADNYSWFQ